MKNHSISFWYHALIKQHNLINTVWLNLHRVDDRLYRSAQPTPWQLKRLIRKLNIQTVINLRGDRSDSPVHILEREVCEEAGVRYIPVELYSRSLPERFRLEELKRAFDNMEGVTLMHCKAGADRSSFAAALYLHWYHDMSLAMAKDKEMRLFPYGYIRQSGAGIIDYYLEQYLEALKNNKNEMDLLEWTYNMQREKIKKEFEMKRKKRWFDFLHKWILGRE